jgi:7-alpha-hydroxysteroid dehydrogenase
MVLDRFRVTDKVAIVTGAGRGIGAGAALALAEAGAHVVCAARTREEIDAVAEQVRRFGRRALAITCDCNVREEIERVAAQCVAEFGRVDILVNNAGGWPPTAALQTGEDMFEQAFHFNVTSAFVMTRLAVPHMLRGGGGAVVNISSAAGRFPLPGFVAYGTAKAAMSFMTRVLAHEFAPRVRVNAIAVGAVETSALAPFLDQELRAKMEALTPMRRIGTVEDIAAGVLYLASPAAGWVTGKVFEIDGGTETSNWPFPPPELEF